MPSKDNYIERSSGILMPIYALPSPYGIGTLGAAARDFVDFLSEAGQSWWQILPVGPTSYGDSPYQSPSTFAGNPYPPFVTERLYYDYEKKQRHFDAHFRPAVSLRHRHPGQGRLRFC